MNLALGLLALVAPLVLASVDLRVEPDDQNVTAGQLAGEWVLDEALTERLGGSTLRRRTVSFVDDPAVAGTIPAKYGEFLSEHRIYFAGRTTFEDETYPCVLVEASGNPHVVYFRERDGDPMGDAESTIVMLVRGTERLDDLLFIGGDFNNEPFAAYQRKERTESEGR